MKSANLTEVLKDHEARIIELEKLVAILTGKQGLKKKVLPKVQGTLRRMLLEHLLDGEKTIAELVEDTGRKYTNVCTALNAMHRKNIVRKRKGDLVKHGAIIRRDVTIYSVSPEFLRNGR